MGWVSCFAMTLLLFGLWSSSRQFRLSLVSWKSSWYRRGHYMASTTKRSHLEETAVKVWEWPALWPRWMMGRDGRQVSFLPCSAGPSKLRPLAALNEIVCSLVVQWMELGFGVRKTWGTNPFMAVWLGGDSASLVCASVYSLAEWERPQYQYYSTVTISGFYLLSASKSFNWTLCASQLGSHSRISQPETRLDVLNLRWCCTSGDVGQCLETILIVAARMGVVLAAGWDAAKHFTMHRTTPTTKNYLAQDVNSAEVEKNKHR